MHCYTVVLERGLSVSPRTLALRSMGKRVHHSPLRCYSQCAEQTHFRERGLSFRVSLEKLLLLFTHAQFYTNKDIVL